MAGVAISEDVCQGCGLCVAACPKKILSMSRDKLNIRGFNPAVLEDASACTGCAFCAMMCPDVAIVVEK